MLSVSRMKSLISPTFSSFALKSTTSLPLSPYFSPSVYSRWSFGARRNHNILHVKSTMSSVGSPVLSNPNETHSLQTEASQYPSGEIHVIVGPMFAGKTTTLLRRIKSESSNGRNVAIIKSNKDVRYGLDSIVTHDGKKLPCWPLADLSSFKQKFGFEAYAKLDVIGIDEAQFFDDLSDFCLEAADIDGKIVVVAGLDGDYLRRSFGSVLDVIPLADTVTKLTARCVLCGKPALFTLRKTEETQTELIGGADVYMPVCRKHYHVSGQVATTTTATKIVLDSHMVHC